MPHATKIINSSTEISGFVGVGLRSQHYCDFLEQPQNIGWLEVHAENYFEEHSEDVHILEVLRHSYPVSLHGVGLGMGSIHGASFQRHLTHLTQLANRIQPTLISEHLCWNTIGTHHFNELLPVTLNGAMLELICNRVDISQNSLAQPILLENVSTFLRYQEDVFTETEFLAEVVKRTGCGILLDVNNLYVNQYNHGESALEALQVLPKGSVHEIHLAGHRVIGDTAIDNHGEHISLEVWQLYEAAVQYFGVIPTLVEWDNDVPALSVLVDEAYRAEAIMHQTFQRASIHLSSKVYNSEVHI